MNKILIHIIGTIVILGFGAVLFVTGLESDGILGKVVNGFCSSRLALYGHSLFCMCIYIDALKRKVPYAFLWLFIMFILPVVGVFIYLALAKRPPMPESTGGERTSKLCPHCGKYYEPPVNYCPHCGARVESE